MIKFSIKNLLTRRRRSLVSLVGITISIALFISTILILRSAQSAFRKPLLDAGSDMIVQLQGEPCVWSIVKLPTDLNPIPFKFIKQIRSLDEVIAVDGALITWAFSAPVQSQTKKTKDPSVISHAEEPLAIKEKDSGGQPCDTGTPGSFCETGEHSSSVRPANFTPIVVIGVNPEAGEIGPIKSSDIKNIQGRYFTKDDNFAVILDKDFARTRNLKLEDDIDIGQKKANKVIGIIDPGYDAKIAGAQVFIPLKVAIEMVGKGDIVDIIFIKLKGGVDTQVVKTKIKKVLGNELVTITTSKDYLSSVAGFSNLAQGLMLVILFVVILISLLFIAKTAYAAVLERCAEAGTLKAVGWHNIDIIKLIAIENSILGFLGGVIGSFLGYLISFIYNANLPSVLPYYLNPYPPCSQYLAKNTLQVSHSFPVGIFLITILIGILIQVISGLIASLRILRFSPTNATRKL